MEAMINILALATLLIGGAEIVYLAVAPTPVRLCATPILRRLKR